MERVNGKIGTLSDWRQVTSGWNASSWHHHFSFLIQSRLSTAIKGQYALWTSPLPHQKAM